jgi:hypothetical protein
VQREATGSTLLFLDFATDADATAAMRLNNGKLPQAGLEGGLSLDFDKDNVEKRKRAVERAKTKEEVECCICYEIIGEKNNCVTECGHQFCFGCMLKAMTRNTACPYCRTELLEDFAGEDSDEEESVDEGGSENDEDEDEDFVDEYQEYAHIEDIAERLEKEGVTMLDFVSLYFNRFSKKDAKWTPEYIFRLDVLAARIEREVENEAKERHNMMSEDAREPVEA